MEIVTDMPINSNEAYEKIEKQTIGSVVFHYAVVREKTGEQVTTSIEFKRGGDMEAELKSISDELRAKWNLEDVLLIRRLGLLKVGDIISLVAASSPRSRDAFEACMHGVESLKKMKTIKKNEQ